MVVWVFARQATLAPLASGFVPTGLRAARQRRAADRDAHPALGRGAAIGVALAALVGLAIRLAQILWWRPTCPVLNRQGAHACFKIGGDALYGYWQGVLIDRGLWFKDPAAYFLRGGIVREAAGKPPLYPGFLAALGKVGLTTPTEQRLALALVGTAAIVMIGLAAHQIAGDRAAVIAAAIAAIHPLLWINDGMLQIESVYTLLIATMIWCSYRWWRDPTWGRLAALGVSLALGATLRAEAQLLVPAVMVPLAWTTTGLTRRRKVLSVVAVGVGSLALWSPWLVWNQTRFVEAPMGTMTVGTGAVLVSAYCDETFYGDALGYWAAHCFTRVLDPTKLDASQIDAVQRRQALDYARDHLGRLPVVVVARVARMYDLYRPLDTTRLNWQVEGRGRWPSYLGLAVHWLLLPFALAGAVVTWRRKVTLVPLLAQVAVVTVTAAISFGVTRYRVPADVVEVLLAAVAFDALLRRRQRRQVSTPAIDQQQNADLPAPQP